MSNLRDLGTVPRRHPAMEEALLRGLIADELDGIRAVLEEMGVRLCADSQVVRHHLYALQTIDELCQRNENLARTLRAGDMVAEAATITLESLRVRLQSALGHIPAADSLPAQASAAR